MSDDTAQRNRPDAAVPRHIAIVMDGNGRWARSRFMPRQAGHRAGVDSVRQVVETAGHLGVEALTLFAFSSENWSRPNDEVSVLMDLMLRTLQKESARLHQNNVRIRLIGERSHLSERLRLEIAEAERLTEHNTGLTLVVAVSFGGRWDMLQAARRFAQDVREGVRDPDDLDEALFSGYLSLDGLPDPDLLIRTGGEQRISNFLLWHLAYAELHFVDTLWPDFGAEELKAAVASFAGRERRFGLTSEQVERLSRA
ncbi:isoprenyl transferase [Aquisalimonas asiatica]|uniref:Ditrans,polycis-undecaprenyl-diphosphate synthase ((2E,6E)-farnesyl-diphosphate specific) n=1 Tax=Aquisalimonas asiatica TaxID=406100 RepID=A0A1H8QKR8_9GAMM|nr:isoprenyl transferase [Aquisalimonas asiatica]SEO54504.1 undecaprenyl diphosphate synthase [Aquisalimonas asiatica]